MAESKGPPRKTTTYNRFSTMASQNQRYNTKQDEFFWLENIMRVAPHKLHSVPGPGAAHSFPLISPCVDVTFRGQAQNFLSIVTAFTIDGTSVVCNNIHSSWGQINNGEVYALVGCSICGGGNMSYNFCVQINHYINDVAAPNSITYPPPDLTDAGSFANTSVFQSDQPAWAAASGAYNGIRIYYDLGLTHVDYHGPGSGGGVFNPSAICIMGNEVWTYVINRNAPPPNASIVVFDRVTGNQLFEYSTFGNTDQPSVANMILTNSYLYFLGVLGGGSGLWKINRSDGTIADFLTVTGLSANFIAVASDDLIYILGNGTPAKVYSIQNFATPVYVGRTEFAGFSPFGGGTAIWNNGTIYFGSNGFAGFTVDISKIVVQCPPVTGPLVASITADSTVVAGNAINVTWADLLLPVATDKIYIKPAPAAGVLGLTGTTIASFTNTSALSHGTTAITIPGGTTPGNYVAMYSPVGTIWAATSNVFTVT